MGPPAIRLQTGLYPPQPSIGGFRPTISPSPIFAPPPPPPVPEDRPQDAEQLQDALASAGVDLKAEEFNLSQLMTPNSATNPSLTGFSYIPSIGGTLQLQQQLQQQMDEGKLMFNRAVLSRFVDKIGIPPF
jgi:hypothetical protein